MDHESNIHQPSLELPAPQVERSETAHPQQIEPERKRAGKAETTPADQVSATPPPIVPVLPLPDDPQAQAPVAPTVGMVTGGSVSADTPAIADDADLIEKEWVDKAKEIVARTREDPHQQNKEMSRVKADYLKKRYNKDLKTSTN